ncbi:MAG: SGNH/GDSL hydrolase family protein [Chitinophagaceae bacterium]
MDQLKNINIYSYLALGDSYTIGEGVPFEDNFPSRTVELLKEEGILFEAPEIVAKTGWTTSELLDGISDAELRDEYDFVSLLIGVNNQYRCLDIADFSEEFEILLHEALEFTGDRTERVVVLSIPDWSVTPFAKINLPDKTNRDITIARKEIEVYNAVCALICRKYKIDFIDITPGTQLAGDNPDMLVADGLHPSAKVYASWAETLSEHFKRKILTP